MKKNYHFTPEKANKLICEYLELPLQETLNYDLLFTAIDRIEATEHPKYKGYYFVFNINNKYCWVNIGENTNGLEGYWSELFIFPNRRIDGIRKCIFEWIFWYKNLSL